MLMCFSKWNWKLYKLTCVNLYPPLTGFLLEHKQWGWAMIGIISFFRLNQQYLHWMFCHLVSTVLSRERGDESKGWSRLRCVIGFVPFEKTKTLQLGGITMKVISYTTAIWAWYMVICPTWHSENHRPVFTNWSQTSRAAAQRRPVQELKH